MIEAKIVADMTPARLLASVAVQRRITLKAVKAGAKLVVPKAKAGAPRRKGSGALKQSQGIKAEKGKRGKTLAFAVVGARKKVEETIPRGRKSVRVVPSYYAHLVEKGTRAHSLNKGAKLGRKGKANIGQGTGKQHPGAKAKPFLGPAWESTKDQVGKVVTETIAAEVKKELRKNAAKAFGKLY
jgi:HK97 gp10 family phage protein